MSWRDETSEPGPDMDATAEGSAQTRARRSDSDVSAFELEFQAAQARRRRRSISSSGSTVHGLDSETTSPAGKKHATWHGGPAGHAHHGDSLRNNGIVALAVEDTTLAVIPADAFKRLTKRFPKATAHIVQGMNYTFSTFYCTLLTSDDR
jgi:lysophospholipid hydrolase